MLDFIKNEEDILKYWSENKIMDKVRNNNRGRKPFYFLDGPPFVSGDLHPGQMWVKSMKDLLLRYKRFRGYDVYDRAGYDVHGLPIEKRAEAQLGVKNKQEIESKIGVERFIKACNDYVEAYIGRMDKDYYRFGMSLDFSNPYIPSRMPYMEVAWKYLKKIDEKGLLYQNRRSITYCTSCGTSVSQGSMEVEYRNDNDPSIYIAFKVPGGQKGARIDTGSDLYLLVWTTTPWTMPANMAVAVNPKERYVIAKVGDRRMVMVKSRLDAVTALLNESAIVEKEFYGSELDGLSYLSPLEEFVPKLKEYQKYHRIVLAEDLVSAGEGSGLVHIAPGHGLDDYLVGKRHNMPIFSPVDPQGNYTEEAGIYKGLKVPEEANTKVIADLKSIHALVNSGSITHSYPHCWRCDTKLIFIATDQWFVNIQKVKKRIIRETRKVAWHPEEGEGWEESLMENSPDWAISRQRYWGIPMPIWECGSCKSRKLIGSMGELKSHAVNADYVASLTDIHRPFIDKVVLKCAQCGGEMHRIKDVLDVWFDSSIAFRASLSEEQFEKLFPMDFILEAVEQLRAWFAYQLKMSVMVHGKRPFKNVVMHGMMLGSDGREMHKKIGNYVPLNEMLKSVTADSFRLWCTSHTPQLDLIFNMDKINEANKVVILLYNMANLSREYADAIGYTPGKIKVPREVGTLSHEDAWILSRLNTTVQSVTEHLDAYEIYKAMGEIRSFLVMDFSRFYLKMAKKKILGADRKAAKATIDLINYVMFNSLVMIAPATPFVAERIYLDNFHFKDSIFLEKWPKAIAKFMNKDIESDFDVAVGAITAILSSREKENVKLRWPLSKAMVDVNSDEALAALQKLAYIVEDYTNIKKLVVARTGKSNMEIRPLFQKIGPQFKENAGAVAESLKSVDASDLLESIAKSASYALHTTKGTFSITQEHFSAVEKAVSSDAVQFKHGTARVDKEISKELRDEALLREFERRVQMARKELGLKKGDKINLAYKALPELAGIIESNMGALKSDISASSVRRTEAFGPEYSVKTFDLEEGSVEIGIGKASG